MKHSFNKYFLLSVLIISGLSCSKEPKVQKTSNESEIDDKSISTNTISSNSSSPNNPNSIIPSDATNFHVSGAFGPLGEYGQSNYVLSCEKSSTGHVIGSLSIRMYNPDTKELCIVNYLKFVRALMEYAELIPADDLIDHIKSDKDYVYDEYIKVVKASSKKIMHKDIIGGTSITIPTWEFKLDYDPNRK
jgi:hypothetical protein